MNTHTDCWNSSKSETELRVERLYAFPSQSVANAFVSATGSYMSSPNISVLLERIHGQSNVRATIQTRRDEFLLESAELITREIDRMYAQFANAEVEVSA
jgi:hypothetical protein